MNFGLYLQTFSSRFLLPLLPLLLLLLLLIVAGTEALIQCDGDRFQGAKYLFYLILGIDLSASMAPPILLIRNVDGASPDVNTTSSENGTSPDANSEPSFGDWRRNATPLAFITEGWSEGFMLGALIIMACITVANMRKGVLLHKLILLEVC